MNFLFVLFRFVRYQFGALLLLLGLCLPVSVLAGQCAEAVAKAISIQGGVESRSRPNDKWKKISVQDRFCFGDQVRTLANSRAALHLNNNSILRLNEHSTISFSHSAQQGASILNLKTGIVHFITRLKQRFEVVTPYVNAAVDGTEFVVAVEAGEADSGGQTRVTVLEGQVRTHNAQGEINLSQGDTALARAGQSPTLQARIEPWNAVSWALYYPAVVDFTTLSNARLKQSLEHYRQGKISTALTTLDSLPDDVFNSNIYVYRAALYLAVGQVVHARADLERALRLESRNGEALALRTIIAVVQNQTEQALKSAQYATELSPNTAATWLAQSYAQQAVFDLEPARHSVERAVKLAPESALAWARLAELHLMFGDLDRTLQAAQYAIELAPELARTQSVLGFAYLSLMKTKKAKRAFEKAISLDQTAPLPHLGLGLAIIREGDLEQGRIEIETATSLDPRHSIIRSYLGKAYYEEKRNDLAVEQFSLAKQLDPKDPTPWYYGAISKQIENNPVEALNDLQESSKLNNNRAVYRSSLLLDSDEAAKSASQARIYSDLGFDSLALIEGWRSVNTDPANHSGHRLLADAYASLPRHEIARVSELLQAQLLQPINTTPIQPQLAESNLGILDGSGPSDLAFNEFNPLFVRNGIRFQTNLLGGGNRTLGNDLVLSGIQDKFSFSLGQFSYRTDGFRENNDQSHDVFDIFAQVAITPKLNIQAEYRDKKTDQGDLTLNFDPTDFSTRDRRIIEQQTRRIGINFSPTTQSTILLSFFNSKKDGKQQRFNPEGPAIDEQNNEDGNQFESQYIFKNELFNIVGGIGQYDI
ncbi:MAG: tetratricopeptide repeat protein, partial [Gammaproteobacteria bacterium]|nr:tetratricopeptide repeat protein [Gammaproteobacteria bacterium]